MTLARYAILVETAQNPSLREGMAGGAGEVDAWTRDLITRAGSRDPARDHGLLANYVTGLVLHELALPSPDLAPRATHKAFVPASNDVERTIAAVWSELLRTEDVDVNDNLFDLGANSLLVMQANGRLRSALGKPISLVEMFQFPSVASLAAHLGESGEGGNSVAADAGADRAQARREAMLRRRVQASTIRSPKR